MLKIILNADPMLILYKIKKKNGCVTKIEIVHTKNKQLFL